MSKITRESVGPPEEPDYDYQVDSWYDCECRI